MSENKFYRVKANPVLLQNELRELFERSGYLVEIGSESVGLSLIIQAKKPIFNLPSYITFLGGETAINVKVLFLEEGTNVFTSGQKYKQYITTFIAELILSILLSPVTVSFSCFLGFLLMFIPAYAAIEQNLLTRKVWNLIEAHISRSNYG